MITFEVSIRRWDRKTQYSDRVITKVSASNVTAAISKASRDFMSSLTRIQKRDAAKLLEIRAVRLVSEEGETL